VSRSHADADTGSVGVDHDAARRWVTAQVSGLGGAVTSAGEPHGTRVWSHTIAFGTTLGPLWFKANAVGTRHEPRLHRHLAGVIPDLVPELLALDEQQGWSLLRDAGPTLRAVASPADQGPTWERLLPRYAQAQLTLAGHLDDLAATGVPERSPASLPEQAAALVDELSALEEHRGGLGPDRRAALEAGLPAYQRWCAELAASGIPCALQHDDLHSANVCVDGHQVRILDWGDASLGHPFGTMLATLNSVAFHAGTAPDDPLVHRLRDAYLEPFTPYAAHADLVRLVEVARRVGRVTRALSWRAALVTEPPEAHAEWDFPVRGWLEETLQD
jgi:Phosphotransferase enzyme family